MMFLIILLLGNAQADQVIGKTNENNIVYCSSCKSYINTSTGEKVSSSISDFTTPVPESTGDAVIGR